jgi:polysaccharide transporter, PST family
MRAAGARAMRWQTLATVVVQLTQAVVTFAVAAVVGPSEFALWGVAGILLNARVVLSLGFGDALIYFNVRDRFRDFVDTAWVGTGLIAAAAAGLVIAFAPQIAGLFNTGFDQDDVVIAIRVAAVAFACSTMETIPLAIIDRGLDLRRRALTEIGSAVIYAAVAAALLAAGAGVWSIIVARALLSVVRLVGFWAVAPTRPRTPPRPRRDVFRTLLGYGAFLSGAALLGFLAENLDTILIGALGSATDLGAYALAFTVASVLPTFLSFTLHRVTTPLYAAVRDSRARLQEAFATALHFVAVVVLPAAAAFVLVAPEALTALLGGQWATAESFLRILGVYALARAVGDTGMSLLAATGRARSSFWIRGLGLAVPLACVWPLEEAWGADGIAVAFAVGRVAVATVVLVVAREALSARLTRLFGPALATAGAGATGVAARAGLGDGAGDVAGLVVFAVVYPLLLLAADPWLRQNGLDLVRGAPST